jgi:hypothetical protein
MSVSFRLREQWVADGEGTADVHATLPRSTVRLLAFEGFAVPSGVERRLFRLRALLNATIRM